MLRDDLTAVGVSTFGTALRASTRGSSKKVKNLSVSEGPLIVDDLEIVIRAAIDGVGLAFMSDEDATSHLTRGALVQVLQDWSQPFPL